MNNSPAYNNTEALRELFTARNTTADANGWPDHDRDGEPLRLIAFSTEILEHTMKVLQRGNRPYVCDMQLHPFEGIEGFVLGVSTYYVLHKAPKALEDALGTLPTVTGTATTATNTPGEMVEGVMVTDSPVDATLEATIGDMLADDPDEDNPGEIWRDAVALFIVLLGTMVGIVYLAMISTGMVTWNPLQWRGVWAWIFWGVVFISGITAGQMTRQQVKKSV